MTKRLFSPHHAAACWLAALLLPTTISAPRASADETCGDYGTQVIFAASPAKAAEHALREEKLVFVLHVSGDFETPDFT